MGRILKTAASLVTGFALAATAAVGAVPAEAATRCDVTFKTYQLIKPGSTGAQAKAMECLLAKAGCNMGACHGNLNGKGGFRLSLRGDDPAAEDGSKSTVEIALVSVEPGDRVLVHAGVALAELSAT